MNIERLYQVVCTTTSYNTTQNELAEVVIRINETLSNNRLPGVNVMEGSVVIGVGGFCQPERTISSRYGVYFWQETGGNNTVTKPCMFGQPPDIPSIRVATRRCLIGGAWDVVDFSQCQENIPTLSDTSGPLKIHSVVVEQGRDPFLTCTDAPIVLQDMPVNTSVMWLHIINGDEVAVPPIGTFENNFIITRNGSDEQITLRPNITLTDIMRLYTRTDRLSDSTSTLDLIGSTGFQTSASIGGVYVCRAQDDFGSRNISVNITVKVPEGESSVVYIRFLVSLRDIPGFVQDNLFMAPVEKAILEAISPSSIGQQTVDCLQVPIHLPPSIVNSTSIIRIECGIHQFDPPLTGNGLLSLGEEALGALFGRHPTQNVSVTGFCDYERTNSTRFGDYVWVESVGGQVVQLPCAFRPGYTANRTCSLGGGAWVAVDYSDCRLRVPQTGFTTFIRFSSKLGSILKSGDLNGAIENIENVILQLVNITAITCNQVTQRLEDELLNRSRVECTIVGPVSSQQQPVVSIQQFEQQISALLVSESFGISGTEVDTDGGFCNSESLNGGTRGVFRWNETEVNSNVSTTCFYGPPEVRVTRFCVSRNNLTAPSIENCRTVISDRYINLNNSDIPDTTLRKLSIIVNLTTALSDRNVDNLLVIRNIFARTAALGQSQIVPETIENAITILDDIEEWPAEILQQQSNQIVKTFEVIVRNLLQQENFTNFIVVSEDIVFVGEKLSKVTFTGRTFTTSIMNGELNVSTSDSATGELSPGQIASISLPQQILDVVPMGSDIILAFTAYTEADLLPVTVEAIENGRTVIGSTVISAIVDGVQDGTQLPAPVEVLLLLSDVGPNETASSRTCVFWDFSAAGGHGNWNSSGCTTVYNETSNVATCVCSHLTNFAVLVDISSRVGDRQLLPPSFKLSLDITSYICIVLSFLGLIGLLVTYLMFKKLRERDVSKFHIQLAVSMLLMLLVFVAGIGQTQNTAGCVTVGMFLHYLLLVIWMWLAAEALLLFQKIVVVFIKVSVKYLIIISIVCWGVPVLPVIITVAIDTDNYVITANNVTGAPGYCFISNLGAFIGGYLGLIFLIILFNTVIFIIVVVILTKHHIKRHKHQMKNSKFLHLPPKEACKLVISLTGIMSLLGLTWVLAVFTVVGVSTNHHAAFGLQWLFVFFNALQGFFLFVFFVLLSSDAQKSWQALVCRKRKTTELSTSKTKVKNGTTSATTKSSKSVSNDYSTVNMEKRQSNSDLEATKITSHDITYEDIHDKEDSPDLELVQVTVNDMAVTAEEQYATIPDMTDGHTNGVPSNSEVELQGFPVQAQISRRLTAKQTHLIETAEFNFDENSTNNDDEQTDTNE